MKAFHAILIICIFLPFLNSCAQKETYEDYAQKYDKPHIAAIPAEHIGTAIVSLYFEGWEKKDGRNMIKCRLVNPSKKSIYFTGYGIQSPWYRMQKIHEDEWTEHSVGWFCGTGLRTPELPAGKSCVFWADFPDDIEALRVGLDLSTEKSHPKKDNDWVVWTEKIKKA